MPENLNEELTEESAKNFALEIFKTKIKPSLERKFIIQHSKGIIKTALNLAKGKNLDLESIKLAGWLHDIGRSESIEGHAAISLRLAEEKFGTINPIITDCILNHGSSKNPQTKEGKIIQLADKLSIMNDFKLFKLLFSKSEYKDRSLEMFGYVTKDLLEVLKKYEF